MHFSELPSNLSLGAKVLYALTRADQASMTRSLRERLEEALAAVQGSLEGFTAELVEAGF